MTDYDKGYYDAMKYIGLKIDFVCNEIGYFGYSFDPNYSVPESFCKELKKYLRTVAKESIEHIEETNRGENK